MSDRLLTLIFLLMDLVEWSVTVFGATLWLCGLYYMIRPLFGWGVVMFATSEMYQFGEKVLEAAVKIVAIVGLPYLMWRAKQAADKLEISDTKTNAQYDVIHDFLNHERRVLINSWATAERAKANLSGKPSDIQAAELAEKALRDHDAGQRLIDEKSKDKNADVGRPAQER